MCQDGRCQCDKGVVEDIVHFLLHCAVCWFKRKIIGCD